VTRTLQQESLQQIITLPTTQDLGLDAHGALEKHQDVASSGRLRVYICFLEMNNNNKKSIISSQASDVLLNENTYNNNMSSQ